MQKVEYRKNGSPAQCQYGKFVAVLSQYRVADVDNVKPCVAIHQCPNHPGFLLESPLALGGVQKDGQAVRTITTLGGRAELVEIVQQTHSVFQSGRVV